MVHWKLVELPQEVNGMICKMFENSKIINDRIHSLCHIRIALKPAIGTVLSLEVKLHSMSG